MTLDELTDGHYFIFEGKPHRVYQKIARVRNCVVNSIKSKAFSAAVSDLGFDYRYDYSNRRVVEISKEEARKINLEVLDKATSKYENCLNKLKEMRQEIENS